MRPKSCAERRRLRFLRVLVLTLFFSRPDTALESLLAYPLADSKHVPIRVPHMHLARIPRHIGRRKNDV